MHILNEVVDFLIEHEGKKVLLFHAPPSKNGLYWYEERLEKFFGEMAEKVDVDILIYGHTHKPYRKDFNRKVFINAGRQPKDGDPRARVTLIDITTDNVNVEFLHVPYDVNKAAEAIIASGLSPCFAEKLKIAR
jgi:predicted phosphodiesterase